MTFRESFSEFRESKPLKVTIDDIIIAYEELFGSKLPKVTTSFAEKVATKATGEVQFRWHLRCS